MKKVIETTIYTIDDHPFPERVFKWVEENWPDIGAQVIHDYVDALEALAEKIQGKLEYNIAPTVEREEFLHITGYSAYALSKLEEDEYPLTGMYCDYVVIECLKEHRLYDVIDQIHSEIEDKYSDSELEDFLYHMCYYFTEDGAYVDDSEYEHVGKEVD